MDDTVYILAPSTTTNTFLNGIRFLSLAITIAGWEGDLHPLVIITNTRCFLRILGFYQKVICWNENIHIRGFFLFVDLIMRMCVCVKSYFRLETVKFNISWISLVEFLHRIKSWFLVTFADFDLRRIIFLSEKNVL